MPSHKNHHYVPKAHFKPFSLNGEGKAIHLFNLRLGQPRQNVPVRRQSAKNYLYGQAGDVGLEKELQKIEGAYADVVRRLADGRQPGRGDIAVLKLFTIIQWTRTDMAAQRMREQHVLMHAATNEGVEPQHHVPDLDLSDRTIIRMSMRLGMASKPGIDDLKPVIIVNRSSKPFFTSDDPAVITNRFYVQKLGRGDFGVSSTGTMFVLPLAPTILFMCYDGGAYIMPDKNGRLVTITKASDVEALNDLQCLNVGANLYFSEWADGASTGAQVSALAPLRQMPSAQVHVLIPAGEILGGERYRVASAEERQQPREHSLLHLQSTHRRPPRWLSKLRFRNPMKYHFNGTGVGYTRHREWLEGSFESFRPSPVL